MVQKIISILCIFFFCFSHGLAQEAVTVQQLSTAHQEVQDALQTLKAQGIDGLRMVEVLGGGMLAGSLVYVAGKGISYWALKEQAKQYAALFAAQKKLSLGGHYLVGELGKKNIVLLQKMLQEWKKNYGYEVPVLIAEPWERSFYVVKPQHSKAFLKKSHQLWNEHLAQVQVKADTRLYTARGLEDITWNAVADFNEKLVLAMEEKGSLAAYVDKFSSLEKAKSFAASRKNLALGTLKYKRSFSLKAVVKSVGKKAVLLAALALLWQVSNGADEQQILARADKNPAILFQLTSEQTTALVQWPEMAERYLFWAALLQATVQLPSEQQQDLVREAQKNKKGWQMQTQKDLEHQLKSVSLY